MSVEAREIDSVVEDGVPIRAGDDVLFVSAFQIIYNYYSNVYIYLRT